MSYEICPSCGANKHKLNSCTSCNFSHSGSHIHKEAQRPHKSATQRKEEKAAHKKVIRKIKVEVNNQTIRDRNTARNQQAVLDRQAAIEKKAILQVERLNAARYREQNQDKIRKQLAIDRAERENRFAYAQNKSTNSHEGKFGNPADSCKYSIDTFINKGWTK